MKTTSRLGVAAVMVGSVVMSGCAYNSSSADVYTASQAQREETVRMGTVDSVRAVKISSNNGQPSGLGALGGGALGAVAGSRIGGGTGSIVTGIIGGIAGAVAGNASAARAAADASTMALIVMATSRPGYGVDLFVIERQRRSAAPTPQRPIRRPRALR